MSLWAAFRADIRANMAVLFAMGFAVSAVISAVAVDAASLYHERRMIQNGVDLAALSAASNPAAATTLAQASLSQAGLLPGASTQGLVVVTGHYKPDPAIPAGGRFVAGQAPLNAVSVTFQRPGALYFARGWARAPVLSATAIANITPQVSFTLGSRLASLNGGIANTVLNSLLGTSVGLTVMDYQNLLGAEVDTFAFLDALAGQFGVTAGSYNDLLALNADHGKLASALATLLTGVERTAMLKLAGTAGHNGTVPLSKLFKLGALGDLRIGSGTGQGVFTKISALELLSVSSGLSNGTHQVSLALAASVPGLVGIDVTLAVGEPPQGGGWYAVGGVGTVVRTSQTRLRIIANLKLKILLLPLVDVRLPLYLDVANGEAIVASATCPSGADKSGSAVISARPGVAHLILGEVNAGTFGAFNTTPVVGTATLINALGIKVTGVAQAQIAQTTPTALAFSPAEIAAGTIKTAKTTTFTGSLVGSLLGDLKLSAAGIALGIIGPLLEALLAPLAPVLDLAINRLLEAVGLSLGEVDVKVYGVRCTRAVLVG